MLHRKSRGPKTICHLLHNETTTISLIHIRIFVFSQSTAIKDTKASDETQVEGLHRGPVRPRQTWTSTATDDVKELN